MSCVKKVRDVGPACAIVEITDKETFEKSVVYSGTFKTQTIKCDVALGEDKVWSEIQTLKSKYGTEDDDES